jgi:hypothetical protein
VRSCVKQRGDSRIGSYAGCVAQIDLTLLHSLIARARAILGPDFEVLYAKHTRAGRLSKPHRLLVLVLRVESLIQAWEQEGSLELDGTAAVTLMELSTALRLLENARRLPAFGRVGATVRQSEDYAHTIVMLSAVWFLRALGNGEIDFVPTAGSPMPDLRIRTGDRTPLYVEVYVPPALIHPPQGVVSPEKAADRVRYGLKRKKQQLRLADSVLLIGGLGCSDEALHALREACRHELARRERAQLLGVAILSCSVFTEFGGVREAPIPLRLHNGSKTAWVPNPHYRGHIRQRAEIPPDAPILRMKAMGDVPITPGFTLAR